LAVRLSGQLFIEGHQYEKNSPDMWTPIQTQNSDNVLHVIDTYIEKMQAFRQAIADGNEDEIRALIEESNKIRRIIR
jgi:prephenate dehydrogenase